MKLRLLVLVPFLIAVCSVMQAAEPIRLIYPNQLISKPAYPVVNDAGYVLLEIWPEVKDVTLSAFFFDELHEKSRNLCEALKTVLDRDAQTRSRDTGMKFTSYRRCMTVGDASRESWIHPKK